MKIATFNVNSIRARLDVVIDWLNTHDPDALALQETKASDGDFPADAFRQAGRHVVFCGEKSYNGVAVVTRERPSKVVFGFDDGESPDAARLVRVALPGLWLVNTYVPQGRSLDHPMYAYKLDWFARLRKYFERHFSPEDPVLWAGDMNVAPTDIDVFRPETKRQHVCVHESVRAAYSGVVAWGFEDIVRRLHPGPGLYSFFDYRQPRSLERNHGWRIDHLLATRSLAARCIEAGIDTGPRLGPRPSDHTVVWARFKRA